MYHYRPKLKIIWLFLVHKCASKSVDYLWKWNVDWYSTSVLSHENNPADVKSTARNQRKRHGQVIVKCFFWFGRAQVQLSAWRLVPFLTALLVYIQRLQFNAGILLKTDTFSLSFNSFPSILPCSPVCVTATDWRTANAPKISVLHIKSRVHCFIYTYDRSHCGLYCDEWMPAVLHGRVPL